MTFSFYFRNAIDVQKFETINQARTVSIHCVS